jgi:hypothetical protein
MTLIEERPFATRSPAIQTTGKALAYELVQGALARWSEVRERAAPAPATAVLLHGILGGRRNWVSFAKRLAQEFPMWQVITIFEFPFMALKDYHSLYLGLNVPRPQNFEVTL